MTTRYVSFAGSTLAISCAGDPPQRIVNFLFARLHESQHAEPHVTLRLQHDEVSGEFSLFEDESLVVTPRSEGAMADSLLWRVGFHLANQSAGGLLLHAAALCRDGKAVVLPGKSGAGKSTLTAWLASNGFDYLTDELVFFPEKSQSISAFQKPLKLKSASRPVVEKHFDFSATDNQIVSSEFMDLISMASIGRQIDSRDVSLSAIVFPQYRQGSDFSLTRLTKAKAGLLLMKSLLNARIFPDHGFSEITRLLQDVPAYSLRYSGFAQLDESFWSSFPDVSR